MKRYLRHILFILISVLLIAAPCDSVAQKKTTTTKTQTAKKSTPAKKTTAAPAKKTSTTTKKTTPTKKQTTPAKKQTTTAKKATSTTKTQTTTKKKTLSRAEYEKQQKDLQKRIKATEQMISDNSQSVKAQSRDIKLREQEIGQRRALLVSMHKEIEAIAQEEDSLKTEIKNLQKSYDAKRQKYGHAMRHLYKTRGGYKEIQFILSAKSLFESMRRMRYLKQYSEWRKQEAIEIESQRVATEKAKDELTKTREQREIVMNGIEEERAKLTAKNQKQEQALNDLKKRGKELQEELAREQKENREIQRKIQQMIEEERRKAEEARRKAEEEAKKNSKSEKNNSSKTNSSTTSSSTKTSKTKTETTYSPSANTALTGSFRSNKGKMPYPVDTNFAFLRHYKEKNDGNVSISLSTGVNAHACAIFEGTVLRVSRSSDDYTIIVSHGDYMSVYSNLSSASVKEGQKVKARQALGNIKTDINGRRGELMFWIYGRSDAENPESWLRK